MNKTTEAIQVSLPETVDVLKWNGYAIQAKELIKDIVVNSDDTEAGAIDVAKQIKMFSAKVEAARKDHVSPFNEFVKRINSAFKPIIEDLANCEQQIKDKLLVWIRHKEQLRIEEERKRQVEFEKQVEEKKFEEGVFGSSDKVVAPPLPIIAANGPARGDLGTASTKTIWRWELVDIKKVSIDLLMINDKLVNEKVRSGIREISGIRIYEDKTIAIR